jgi:hypothetical protein
LGLGPGGLLFCCQVVPVVRWQSGSRPMSCARTMLLNYWFSCCNLTFLLSWQQKKKRGGGGKKKKTK